MLVEEKDAQWRQKKSFFMLLKVIRHGGQWEFLARMFKLESSTFERLIVGFIHIVADSM